MILKFVDANVTNVKNRQHSGCFADVFSSRSPLHDWLKMFFFKALKGELELC